MVHIEESLAVSLNVTPDQLNQHAHCHWSFRPSSGYEPPYIPSCSVLTVKYLQPLQITEEVVSQETKKHTILGHVKRGGSGGHFGLSMRSSGSILVGISL
jgi:hypothetical protein